MMFVPLVLKFKSVELLLFEIVKSPFICFYLSNKMKYYFRLEFSPFFPVWL